MKIVITNNPMVRDRFPEAEYHNTDFLGVLKTVRDRIHAGHKLLTHPLSGSVKPGETPYKTVIISTERGMQSPLVDSMPPKVDGKALSIIEDSIQTCQKFMADLEKSGIKKNLSAKILEDFQLIDFDLVFSD
jgi:hypothetical protein